MPKPGTILLLIVIVALLPLRSIAAAMAGYCAAGQEIAAAQSTADAQDTRAGSGEAHTHCPGAVFLPAATPAPLPARSGELGIAPAEHSAPTFIPDPLDPPPLPLLR